MDTIVTDEAKFYGADAATGLSVAREKIADGYRIISVPIHFLKSPDVGSRLCPHKFL